MKRTFSTAWTTRSPPRTRFTSTWASRAHGSRRRTPSTPKTPRLEGRGRQQWRTRSQRQCRLARRPALPDPDLQHRALVDAADQCQCRIYPGRFVRRDQYNYYPSDNPFADLGPPIFSRETVGQDRTLTNAGLRSDVSYVKGIHNVKVGALPTDVPERERSTWHRRSDAAAFTCRCQRQSLLQLPATHQPFGTPCTTLLPYDLTPAEAVYSLPRPHRREGTGALVAGHDHQGQLVLQPGTARRFLQRSDHAQGSRAASRHRLQHQKDQHRTARLLCANDGDSIQREPGTFQHRDAQHCAESASWLFRHGTATPLAPGWRNEFHAGLQQAFGRYLVFSGEYIWKYTHNAYDFSVLGNTPITFPIEWNNSKIPGLRRTRQRAELSTASRLWPCCPAWQRASSRRKSAGPALSRRGSAGGSTPSASITTKNST